jgi:hypothetical protein
MLLIMKKFFSCPKMHQIASYSNSSRAATVAINYFLSRMRVYICDLQALDHVTVAVVCMEHVALGPKPCHPLAVAVAAPQLQASETKLWQLHRICESLVNSDSYAFWS